MQLVSIQQHWQNLIQNLNESNKKKKEQINFGFIKLTIEISSSNKPNCSARSVNNSLTRCEMRVRCVINSIASN